MERYTDGLRNVTPKKLQYAFCGRDVTKKRIPYRIDHVECAFP